MNDKLFDAMNEVRNDQLQEAIRPKKRRRWVWIPAVAAVLALVILGTSLAGPIQMRAMAISQADYGNYSRPDWEDVRELSGQLAGFMKKSLTQTLSQAGQENAAYSPVNLYMGVTLLAELTGGNAQLLQALESQNLEQVRSRANLVWNACYQEKNNKAALANSIWLDKDLEYDKEILDLLAENYFTSSYEGDFGSGATNRAIARWIDQQTGGILKKASGSIDLDPNTVFALYSTVYYQAKWQDAFSSRKNTEGIFYGTQETVCTYMNKKEMESRYYWGQDFGAVTLSLKDGSRMWLILPDAGKTPADVLNSGAWLDTVLNLTNQEENSKYMKVNLSVPKFDISCRSDMKADLQAMGITDVFEAEKAPFGSFVKNEMPVWVSGVNQATRVCIDEEGVTAASYLEIPGAGAAQPPEEIIDFILDRPFLFVITNGYHLPLFAGVVNHMG